jgi:thioredoxin-related protein
MNNAVRTLALLPLLMPALANAQEAKTIVQATARPSIYNVKLDAREQVAKAGAIAKRDNQRLLVMFGGDWCGWCHKLHDTFKKDANIRKILLEDYKLVMVDTKAPSAEALLKECQGDLKQVGYPFLAVLDADGKIITRQETDALEEGDHHDPRKVRDFLEKWAPEKQDAAKVLKVAMDRASSEDKRVFLHFGAPWCGWCHKLDDFLAREDIAKVMGKDFIDVKIDVDRMIGGKDLEAKFRKHPEQGIPWFVFLDAKGEAIADADGPKGNIGYPAAPEEISHFMKMLGKAVRKIDAADLETIEKTLKDAPEAKAQATRQ